jgi:hypothetical protein
VDHHPQSARQVSYLHAPFNFSSCAIGNLKKILRIIILLTFQLVDYESFQYEHLTLQWIFIPLNL